MPDPFQLKLYPRGFLGRMLGTRIERRSGLRENNLGFSLQKLNVMRDPKSFEEANAAVEALYGQYIKQAVKMSDFDFRRDVLVTALNAFGTHDFYTWYVAQFRGPSCGDLHRRFLDDTLSYIMNGHRDLSLENWDALLEITDAGAEKFVVSDTARQFFGIRETNVPYEGRSRLTDVIQMWCSQPNGMEDLLGTLHILFGSH